MAASKENTAQVSPVVNEEIQAAIAAATDYEKIGMTYLVGFYDTNPIYMVMEQAVDVMRRNKDVKANTEAYRHNRAISNDVSQSGSVRSSAKRLADKAKKALPVLIPPALCKGGKGNENIERLIPVMATDQDHLTPEQMAHAMAKLRESPYTWVCEPSPSDEGVRTFVKIADIAPLQQLWNEAKSSAARLHVYRYAWEQLARYVEQLTGIPVDSDCAKPTQPYSLAHCDEPYYNRSAVPFSIDMTGYEAPKPGRPKKQDTAKGQQGHTAALADVLDQVLAKLADDGHKPDGGRNSYLHRFASRCNHLGVAQDEVVAWAIDNMEEPDFDAAEIRATVGSAYKHTEEHGTQAAKKPEKPRYCTGDELAQAIADYGEFRYNEVTLVYEVKTPDDSAWRRLADEDENEMYRRILMSNKVTSVQQIHNLIRSHLTPHYHPFHAYLEALPACTLGADGRCSIEGRSEAHDYISEFASRVEVDGSQEEFVHYFRIWLVSMVKSMAIDDEVNQCALGLFGPQGIYKTTFFQMLLPPELRREYFYLKTNSMRFDKDDKIKMATTALICLEEMDTMSAAEMNQMKALFTMNSIDERPAYARNVVHMPRRSSFGMTGNEPQFITDTTGSRRFFPFVVKSIEDPRTFADFEGLYTHAWALAQPAAHYNCYVSREDIARLHERNKAFMVPVIEHQLIDKYIGVPFNGANVEWESIAGIKSYLERFTREILSVRKIQSYLTKELGIKPRRTNRNTLYPVIFKTEAEVKAARKFETDMFMDDADAQTPDAESTKPQSTPF